jgi:demethylspheroidene O-methyltransferase
MPAKPDSLQHAGPAGKHLSTLQIQGCSMPSQSRPNDQVISQPLPRLRDLILTLRDRLVTSPRFQRWAARTPLVRSIARREAQAAFDLCAGFVYSQVLFACVKLSILEAVRTTPVAREQLLLQTSLPHRNAELLIEAALALGLLSRRSGTLIGLGMTGAAIVANPAIAAMVEHHALLYQDLSDPVGLLTGKLGQTRLAAYWPYATRPATEMIDEAETRAYSALMTASQAMLADDILATYPFDRHSRVLEIGAGEGEFAMALAGRCPALSIHLVDLPPVAARASQRIAARGLDRRITVSGGDAVDGPLPQGFDAVALVRVAHDHDDDRLQRILAKAYDALEAGGSLVIAEPMSGVAGAERVADVYFAFYLLAMGSGRPRTTSALARLLEAAGFERIRTWRSPRPMLTSVLSGRKSGHGGCRK